MRIIPLFVLIIVLVGTLYLPVHIPYTVESIGLVYPHREWKMMKDAAGNITTSLQDFQTGTITSAANFQFERGDLVRMSLGFDPGQRSSVSSGDTLLNIYTILIDQQITQTEGDLARLKAQLTSNETGEKSPVVKEAENKLQFAEEDFRLKQKVYVIQKQLYDEQVISLLEYSAAENTKELARIQVEVAQKALEIANTGLKPADVDITRRGITALENRLRVLREQKASYRILAPFAGRIIPAVLPTDMLVLHDTLGYVVHVPIPISEAPYLSDMTQVRVQNPMNLQDFSTHILQTNAHVEVIGGRQVIFLEVIVPARAQLKTGLGTLCTIQLGDLNLRAYLKRVLHINF